MLDAYPIRATRPAKRRVAAAAIAVFTFLGLSPVAAAWEPESDFSESTTYMGLSGVFALTNIGDEIGQRDSRPIEDINSATESGGLRIWFGARPIPYIAFEVQFQYLAAIQIRTPTDKLFVPVYSGAIDFKGYPFARLTDTVLEGRLQPYLVVSPTVVGVDGTEMRSPIAFAIGVGLGTDYWLNDTFSLNFDARYSFGTGNLQGLDYALFGLGIRYHFE